MTHRKMADPIQATVTVTLLDTQLHWQMTSADIQITDINCNGVEEPVLTFNNKHGGDYHNGFEVTFELVDRTGKGYGFFFADPNKPDPNDAIWVAKIVNSDPCPPEGSKWGGFKPRSVDRDVLVVDNKNDRLQYFGFALLLSLEDETDWSVKLDPVGNNMNGTSSAS